jgi:protein-L-isoaspartate(D-aspartate) O-methyltransferase
VARGETGAQERNEQLVSQLESSGALHDAAAATAFRAVLRHHFLPGHPLDEVYEDTAIMTKIGDSGLPVSSSSQPAIMAIMLQQLDLKPGHRVLEVGAGTGYNAALMAHLVGGDGRVVTLDVDPELCRQARANLAAAGVWDVDVIQADGAGGWPAEAPYDRIMVTAAASDLSPAWLEQLVEEGRLVLPLSLAGPLQLQQCVAFVRYGRAARSVEVTSCGFMPLRGSMAPAAPARDEQLAGWLARPGRPSGRTVPAADLRAGFETWLAMRDDRYVRARLREEDSLTFGLRSERGAALLAGEGDELAVTVFADGDSAAERLAAAHAAWSRRRLGVERLRIEAYPDDEAGPDVGASGRVVRRSRFTFVVREAS